MDLKANTYIVVADLAGYITESSDTANTATQDHLKELINSCTDWVNSYLRFEVKKKAVTDKYWEPIASNRIALRGKMTTVSTVKIGGMTYAVDTDCLFDRGHLVFFRPFIPGEYLIELTGFQGWDSVDIPSDLISALKELIAWNFGRIKSRMFGVRSRTVGDSQTEFVEIQAPRSVTDALNDYRMV